MFGTDRILSFISAQGRLFRSQIQPRLKHSICRHAEVMDRASLKERVLSRLQGLDHPHKDRVCECVGVCVCWHVSCCSVAGSQCETDKKTTVKERQKNRPSDSDVLRPSALLSCVSLERSKENTSGGKRRLSQFMDTQLHIAAHTSLNIFGSGSQYISSWSNESNKNKIAAWIPTM